MDKKDWRQIMRAMSLLTEVGLMISASAGIGFGFGYLVDNFFGFDLIFEIIGLLIGIISGFYAVYKLLISTFED